VTAYAHWHIAHVIDFWPDKIVESVMAHDSNYCMFISLQISSWFFTSFLWEQQLLLQGIPCMKCSSFFHVFLFIPECIITVSVPCNFLKQMICSINFPTIHDQKCQEINSWMRMEKQRTQRFYMFVGVPGLSYGHYCSKIGANIFTATTLTLSTSCPLYTFSA
jgi:hypothetical protein